MNNLGFEILKGHGGPGKLNLSKNNSNNHGCDEEYMPSNYSCHFIPDVAVLVVYILILFCNFTGDGLVVSIILLKQRMRTFTNFLLLNLCIADLAIGLFCMTLEIPMEIHPHKWIYGPLFCHFLYPIQTAAVYASVLTLVVLSCSRYRAIVHPYATQTHRIPCSVVDFVDLGVEFSVSDTLYAGTELNERSEHCEEIWNKTERKVFTSLTFIFHYGIPILVIGACYSIIIYELHFKIRSHSSRVEDVKRKENQKLIKLLVAVTTTFALCVLPYHIVALWVEFGNGVSFTYIDDLSIVTFFVLYLNSALDPILYNVFSSIFRNELKKRSLRLYLSISENTEVIKMKKLRRWDTKITLLEVEQ